MYNFMFRSYHRHKVRDKNEKVTIMDIYARSIENDHIVKLSKSDAADVRDSN